MSFLRSLFGEGVRAPAASPIQAGPASAAQSAALPAGTPQSFLSEPGPHGRVMITNGGPHAPELWGQVTAEHICPVDAKMIGPRRIAVLKLQAAIQEALTGHHSEAAEAEKARLVADHASLNAPHDVDDHVTAAIVSIQAAAKGTEWEEHFNSPEVVAMLKHELGVHFRSNHDIERSWHADRHIKVTHPDHIHPEVRRYLGRRYLNHPLGVKE